MAKTISMSVGRVAILHDVRREISSNVDPALTHQNDIIIDKLKDYDYNLEAFTNAQYQPYIDEYNAKQTRDDRKKYKSYVELLAEENKKLLDKAADNKKKGIHTSVRKPTKLAHEYVLQIGDRETDGTSNPNTDIDKHREYARQVVEELQQRYLHVEVLLATYHADEPQGTPHAHILVQFDGDGYKQGLSHQISISKALELDGFERSNNRGNYAINRWCEDVKDTIMTDKLKELFREDRKVLGEHRRHEDVRIFREKAKAEEKALLEQRQEIDTHNKSQYQILNNTYNKLVTCRDKLNQQANNLETDKNTFNVEKTNFEAYKASETKELHDQHAQLESFTNRAYEIFTESQDFLKQSKRLYNALDAETRAHYHKPLEKLNESLLQQSYKLKEKSMSL